MFEQYTFLCHRDVDFTDDKGNAVKGATLYFFRDATPGTGWQGNEVYKTFVRAGSEVMSQIPAPLTDVQLTFNRYGKIASILDITGHV